MKMSTLVHPKHKFVRAYEDVDRYAVATETKFGTVTLNTPSFATLVKTTADFQTYFDLVTTYPTKHLGICIVPIICAISTSQAGKERAQQKNLEGNFSAQKEKAFFDNTIIAIDPYTEYPYYEFSSTLEKMKENIAIPSSYQLLVSEFLKFKSKTKDKKEILAWKKKSYLDYWLEMRTNPSMRANFANDYMRNQSERGASIGFPSGPLIINEQCDDLFDLTKTMNRVCKAVWKDGECLTSVVMEPECLTNDDFISNVLEYIEKEDSHTVIKIKNNDLTKRKQRDRDRYRNLQEEIANMKKRTKKLYMILEAGPQVYPSAVLGFDIVSTGMKAFDIDSEFGKSKFEGKGGWYDPQYLKLHDYGEVQDIFTNHKKLPCTCEICKQITSLEAITTDFWNIARRKHYVLTMEAFMSEIRQKIAERHIEQTREKILLSTDLCILKSLIPTS